MNNFNVVIFMAFCTWATDALTAGFAMRKGDGIFFWAARVGDGTSVIESCGMLTLIVRIRFALCAKFLSLAAL